MTVEWWHLATGAVICVLVGVVIGYVWGYKDRSRQWR